MIALGLAVFALLGSAFLLRQTARNLRVYAPAPVDGSLPADLRISVCVPLRDEQDNLPEIAETILRNDHTEIELLLYDDGSTDATPQIIERLAAEDPRVRPIMSRPLPPGWNGKQHACAQMGLSATGSWLLFTDADVRFSPDALRRSVAEARRRQVALLSTFPRQITESFGERLMVPMIFFLLLSYLPMRRMRRTLMPSASAGCGQFLLVDARVYRGCGGHTAFPDSMHDGIALPRLLRRCGYRTDLFDGQDLAEVRMYRGWVATWRGFAKNAYEGLGHLGLLLFLTVFHTLVYVLPPGLMVWGVWQNRWWTVGVSAAAVATAVLQRRWLGRHFGQPRWLAWLHPPAVVVMTLIQWHSWWWHVTGRSAWRGRTRGQREQVTLVDVHDRPVGQMEKLAAHRGGGHLHRAFSVLLFDEQQRVLLQQRAASKYHFPGRWANACCGHPRPGESTVQAAQRRVYEELGLRLDLQELASFHYEARDPRTRLIEREIDHVVVGRIRGDEPIHVNPLEASAVRWVSPAALGEALRGDEAEAYAPWVARVWATYQSHREPPATSLDSTLHPAAGGRSLPSSGRRCPEPAAKTPSPQKAKPCDLAGPPQR